MTDKEVRKLKRGQLVSLLAEAAAENDALRAELERLREQITALEDTNERLETLGDLSRQILETVSRPEAQPEEAPTAESEDAAPEEDAVPAPAEEPGPAKDGPETETLASRLSAWWKTVFS